MVGRSGEIAVIHDVLSRGDRAGGLLFSGQAGVGKTRLARHALKLAADAGRPCRWIVATASAKSVPLGAFADFATDVGPDPIHNVEAVIAALAGNDVATVIGVDDAHLLDDQSALVIHQLVRRQTATVILTRRADVQAPTAITSLAGDPRLCPMEIAALSSAQVRELLSVALGGVVESSTARLLWRFTQGNVLYLRQLVSDELSAGRLASRSGVWVWDREPRFSPTLIDLIESNIGRRSDDVVRVLDLLAVEEPLEVDILADLASAEGVSCAQSHGLVIVDRAAGVARLAHPMFGEVRRNKAGKVRLRTLRGQLASAIGRLAPVASPVARIRRAVLLIDSDARPDPALLLDAAGAALQLLNLTLANRLAQAAVRDGGGRVAQITYALTLATVGRGSESEALFARLSGGADVTERAHIALLRSANLATNVGRPTQGLRVLDLADAALAASSMTNAANAIRGLCHAALGQPALAIRNAECALAADEAAGLPAVLASWALICGHGDEGDLDRMSRAAARGYAFADAAPEASFVRFPMALSHADGLRLAGELNRARTVVDDLGRQSSDLDSTHSVVALLQAGVAMWDGRLDIAERLLREALAVGADRDGESSSVRIIAGIWLAAVLAIAGEHCEAHAELEAAQRGDSAELLFWESEAALARAWVHAAAGVPSRAVAVAMEAADRARWAGRPAREVVCLQTATQFGDSSTCERLAHLRTVVAGPRAVVAHAHAHALAESDGAGLLAASQAYEAFGDRVAAADAAAQAACVYRLSGLHGSSLTAAAASARLADACGAHTPATRALAGPVDLTTRQREVIALAATGLSNKEIATTLLTSVRTVEGHLFRASQRAGVNTRDELIRLFGSQSNTASLSG